MNNKSQTLTIAKQIVSISSQIKTLIAQKKQIIYTRNVDIFTIRTTKIDALDKFIKGTITKKNIRKNASEAIKVIRSTATQSITVIQE